MTPAFYNSADIVKIERSYQMCAMQKATRIFSTKLQFGTVKRNISKDLILRRRVFLLLLTGF